MNLVRIILDFQQTAQIKKRMVKQGRKQQQQQQQQ